MAKAKRQEEIVEVVGEGAASGDSPLTFTCLDGVVIEFDPATAPAHAIYYLLQYGIKQKLDDAVAGKKKILLEAGKSEDEAKAELAALQRQTWERILDGTISTRAPIGPRKSPLERHIDAFLMEKITALAAKQKKAVPKGEELKALKAQILANPKNREAAEAEAKRRMQIDDVEVELDF